MLTSSRAIVEFNILYLQADHVPSATVTDNEIENRTPNN